VQKKGDLNDKLNAAYKYYDKKDYYKATMLFDEVVPLIKGKVEGEKAMFYFAYCYYYQKQYIMSAYYFREYYETFPRGEFTEESNFMYAKSLFKESPDYNLDQTNTNDAIRAIQRFATKYPRSGYLEEANGMMDQLNAKLEKKEYESARLYYRLSEYNSFNLKAAVISFDNFIKQYPSSVHAEEVSFMKVRAQYNLAIHSDHSKQRERFFETIDFYHNFIDKYPNSKYKRDAESIYEDSIKKLDKLNS